MTTAIILIMDISTTRLNEIFHYLKMTITSSPCQWSFFILYIIIISI